MTEHTLTRSKTPIVTQIIVGGLAVLTACILITLFFSKVHVAQNLQNVLLIVLWVFAPILWLAGSYITLKKWPKTTYALTADSLRIHKKGWFGASSDSVYRYDAILTLTMTKSPFGDFGNITITFAQLSPITLRTVLQPHQSVEKIKAKVAKSQPITQTVLS